MPHQNPRILLIEDEALIGTMVRLNLESEGYDTTWSRDGNPALEAAINDAYDVILLDINLPDGNGAEMLANARARGLKTPVIMLTAELDIDTKVTAFDAGADDYLAYPFVMRELLARVTAVLRRTTKA